MSGDVRRLPRPLSVLPCCLRHVARSLRVLGAPAALTDGDWTTLLQTPVGHEDAAAYTPSWLSAVCRHREAFAHTCFVVSQNGVQLYFKFLYAMQKPRLAVFAPMLESSRRAQPVQQPTCDTWETAASEAWRLEWEVSWTYFKPSSELPQVPLG